MPLDNTKTITSVTYNGNDWPVGKPEQSKTLTLGAAAPSTVTPDSGKVLSSVPVVLDTSVINAANIAKGVTMLGIPGAHEGGGSVPTLSKGVKFIDYDGTTIATWETSSVASKTTLPDNPEHDGLTAQGWNWSLAEVKSYIATYPDSLVTVGQMYITDDGKTRIYIHLEDGRLSPILGICPNGSVDIDWGDGSAHNTVTGTSISTIKKTQHTYAHGGDYLIALTVTGTMGIVGNSSYGSQLLWKNTTTSSENRVYQNAIQKVTIGSGVTSIGNSAFHYCHSLTSVTIPNGVTSIGTYAFSNCYNLASVTIPNGVTSIGTNAFSYCYNLASVTIGSGVTSIGDYVFSNCWSLTSVTIPNGVTSIGINAFSYCYNLASVTIGSGVTSIGDYAFYNCHSLTSVTIPNGVTSIDSAAFSNCYGLGFIKFTRQTPPTVSNSNAWSKVPTDCIIYVPAGTLSAYKSATNYPSPSTYTYVEY